MIAHLESGNPKMLKENCSIKLLNEYLFESTFEFIYEHI